MNKRVGASSKATVDPTILLQLNEGAMETATLSEALAVDFGTLMINVFPQMKPEVITSLKQAQPLGITKRMELAAVLLSKHIDPDSFNFMLNHASDTVRGWAAYLLGLDSSTSLEDKLLRIWPLADDPHFGVREWAWLALRPAISLDIRKSIQLLLPWTTNESENIRRFAIESTRPRGVWAKHIQALKTQPAIGEPLLDQVMKDNARYVQNSCANWLNDAAKSDAQWVASYCEKWQNHASDAVNYITRRALRNAKPE